MRRVLFHIYGPFSIHSYGLAIAIGLLIAVSLIKRHQWFLQLKLQDRFAEIILLSICAALLGGRLLFLLTEPQKNYSFANMTAFWEGGLSLLGAIIGVLTVLPLYLKRAGIPILRFFDLIALHAALLQSIARVGCFFAGCCYGRSTTFPWGIVYTDINSSAPLYQCIHPAQLYSATILLCIFVLHYFILQKVFQKPGQILCSYMICMSAERFLTDFWRADQSYLSGGVYHLFSSNQWIALSIFTSSCIAFFWISTRDTKS